jgi:dihydrofolate reductase
MGLIDEYKLTMHPIILGSGLSVFTNNNTRNKLKLLDSKTLNSGVVTLHYATA